LDQLRRRHRKHPHHRHEFPRHLESLAATGTSDDVSALVSVIKSLTENDNPLPAATGVPDLSTSDLATVSTELNGLAAVALSDTSGAITTTGGTTAAGLPIEADTSFIELEADSELDVDEDEDLGKPLASLKALVTVAKYALLKNPASQAPTRTNSNPQYAIVYARDASGKWWWFGQVNGVFLPDTVNSIHSEYLAWQAGAFNPDNWNFTPKEIVLFTWYSPCTTTHGKDDAFDGCQTLVIEKAQKALNDAGIGFTVMQAEWYQNGHFFDGTNAKGQAAVALEKSAYNGDGKLKTAQSNGMFRMVTIGWTSGSVRQYTLA